MKGRIALITGAAAVFLGSFALGLADVRALAHDDDKKDDKKIEKKIVVRSGSGRLGVSIDDTTGEPRGAMVRSVAEDSAAEKAGIKEGDVIVRFDGEAVRSASHLSRLVAETPAGRLHKATSPGRCVTRKAMWKPQVKKPACSSR